jgi:hypothetical protein
MRTLGAKLYQLLNSYFGPFTSKRLLLFLGMTGAIIIPSIFALTLLLVLPYCWLTAESKKETDILIMDYAFVSLIPAFFLMVEGIKNSELISNLFVIFYFYQLITSLVFYLMTALSWKLFNKNHGVFLAIALLLKLIPFMGITEWISPLQLSGVLFPSFGVFGLLCLLLFISLLNNKRAVALFIVLAIGANTSFYFNKKTAPLGWEALYTNIVDKNKNKLIYPLLISASKSDFILTPESAGADIYNSKNQWLNLLAHDKFVFFEVNGIEPKTKLELNALTLVHDGKMEILYEQRQPMPFWMWRPYDKETTPSHWFSNHKPFLFQNMRLSAFICYESFLIWPYIFSLMHKPDLMLISANFAHADSALLKKYHARNIEVWSRLFNVPALISINSKGEQSK